MSPSISRGEASVAILAETFGLSLQAIYARKGGLPGRQRTAAPSTCSTGHSRR